MLGKHAQSNTTNWKDRKKDILSPFPYKFVEHGVLLIRIQFLPAAERQDTGNTLIFSS